MRKPASNKVSRIPAFEAIRIVVRLPGAMPASTPGAMCLPLTMAATDSRSSKDEFVQEPITTCVTFFPARLAMVLMTSGL